jgi:hypothetical protein
MELYKQEFPRFGELDVKLPEGFEDSSDSDDVCPSFMRELSDSKYIVIFVDFKDPAERELQCAGRFHARYEGQYDLIANFETNNWEDMLKFVADHVN